MDARLHKTVAKLLSIVRVTKWYMRLQNMREQERHQIGCK